MRLWRHSARRASPQPCAAACQSDFTPSTRLACSRAAHTHDSPVDLHAGAATGAADELYELVRTRRPSQWQDSERARVDELVEAVVSQNAPWPRTGLFGKWRLAYLQPGPNGEGVDRRVPFPEFGFNEQYQIFSSGRVTNVGEVLGPAVRVEVKGGLEELDSSVTRSPKRFRALIDSGALCAGNNACAPLPISGEGLFDGVYLDERLRVGQNLNGGGARIVQVRVE